MGKLSLQIKSIALEDMEKIADFIAKDNPKAAYDLLNDFYTSFDNLCLYPKMGSKSLICGQYKKRNN
ncbi:MAG: type II toxin-antitoxin system RelE/ParE family toxin [Candidatus Gastranaerophilales bacterium]|nr:type II toxin-antitoxin system RelE/ParE family toxin [Candidatus Gastranaerophilales bacterium]